ncbi:MAG: energy-coupling factor ABC transporter permease [Pseudomonadota bacterium]
MSAFQLLTLAVCLVLIAAVVKNTNFPAMLSDKQAQHRIFGAATALFVLWLFRVSIHDGMVLQFLGLTAFTLILGFRWAVITSVLVLVAITLIEGESFYDVGIIGLCGVVMPIVFSYTVYTLTFHKMPKHLFTYIFACGFFPAAVSIALKMLLMSGYYYYSDMYTWDIIYDGYVQLIWLLMFQEAFFNGMVITCLVVYKPQWLYTYNDKFYLDGK